MIAGTGSFVGWDLLVFVSAFGLWLALVWQLLRWSLRLYVAITSASVWLAATKVREASDAR